MEILNQNEQKILRGYINKAKRRNVNQIDVKIRNPPLSYPDARHITIRTYINKQSRNLSCLDSWDNDNSYILSTVWPNDLFSDYEISNSHNNVAEITQTDIGQALDQLSLEKALEIAKTLKREGFETILEGELVQSVRDRFKERYDY